MSDTHTHAMTAADAGEIGAVLSGADLELARSFALAEKSAATRRAYQSDFRAFAAWCRTRGVASMPAAPDTVGGFLAEQAATGRKASTITRRLAAIGYAHRLRGAPSPADAETVRAVLRGIRRQSSTSPTQKAPATAERVARMLEALPTSIRGKRDRALIALGFAGAFRRSELVALEVADLVRVPEGLRITIRRSKTDQTGRGQEIAVPRGTRLRPVQAVLDWLAAAAITSGPVFRAVDRRGHVGETALTPQVVALVVKARAEEAGLDPAEFAGHSLRAGFLTSAAEAGADVLRMMEVSRHRRVETVSGYVRRANQFQKHAGEKFL